MEKAKEVTLTNSLAFTEDAEPHSIDYVAVKADSSTVFVDGAQGILVETELGSVFIYRPE